MPETVDLHELIAWYHDAGVTVALADEPIDRFAASQEVAKPKAAPIVEQKSKGPAPAETARSEQAGRANGRGRQKRR